MRAASNPRGFRLLGAALLVLALGACGGGGSSASNPDNNPPAGNPPGEPAAGSPRAVGQSIPLIRGTHYQGTLSAREGDTVAEFRVVEPPAHGVLHLLDPVTGAFRYIPDERHVGADAFGFRARNDRGESATAHVSFQIDAPTPLLTAAFADAALDGWTAVSETNTPYDWRAGEGLLRQRNAFAKFAGGATPRLDGYSLGGYLYWEHGSAWTDYRIDAMLHPQRAGGELGLLIRYAGPTDYYRLSFSGRDSFARLERRTAAGFTTLARAARGPATEMPFAVRVDVDGGALRVFVDEEPLFASLDPHPLEAGTIALYARGEAGYSALEVTPLPTRPVLMVLNPQPYAVLPSPALSVETLATGTTQAERVRVRAAHGDDVPAEDTRELDAQGRALLHLGAHAPGGLHLHAELLDGAGHVLARTEVPAVGMDGHAYLMLGDSITSGTGDAHALDDASADGRVRGAGGPQAPLADALAGMGPPAVVFDEAVPGDRVRDLVARLDSVAERHPGEGTALVLIGTNDAGGGRSVFNFHNELGSVIERLTGEGRRTYVARIPPAFGASADSEPYGNPWSAARNVRTREYNQVIEGNPERPLHGHLLGPDLFRFFLDEPDADGVAQLNRVSLYADNTHPNSLGHRIIAQLWYRTLSGEAEAPLPFFVDGLAPLGYRQNLRSSGDALYLGPDGLEDAAGPRLLSAPPGWEDAVWILPRAQDRDATHAAHLRLAPRAAADVYIAYDAAATVVPGFLSRYAAVPDQHIETTAGRYALWHGSLQAGETLTLDANRADGADGAHHYLVALIPR